MEQCLERKILDFCELLSTIAEWRQRSEWKLEYFQGDVKIHENPQSTAMPKLPLESAKIVQRDFFVRFDGNWSSSKAEGENFGGWERIELNSNLI